MSTNSTTLKKNELKELLDKNWMTPDAMCYMMHMAGQCFRDYKFFFDK
jgi:hypothetical protein